MPEQKSFTVEGTQVLWKHYRKKQGKEDVIKFCFGKALPEKQWATHHIPHATVNACTTSTALAAAVRSLAAEILGATIKPPKNTGCRCAAAPPHGAKVVLERESPTADAAAGLSEPPPSEPAIAAAAAAFASASHLLIAAGAGFSADSGLPVYADIAAVPEYSMRRAASRTRSCARHSCSSAIRPPRTASGAPVPRSTAQRRRTKATPSSSAGPPRLSNPHEHEHARAYASA